MNKQTLMKLLKKVPNDAKRIRVASLWNEEFGDFDYVSFSAPSAQLPFRATSSMGNLKWIVRVPKE